MKLRHLTCLLLTAAALVACTKKSPPNSVSPTSNVVSGNLPLGYAHRSTDGVASYTVVGLNHIPNWHNQSFSASLNAFQKGCPKLQNKPAWANICRIAMQTQNDNKSAKSFFEQNFTAWQVRHNGSDSGTVTGYYEPVLHGDKYATPTARFPIYGVPHDMVSVSLPNHLRGSKGMVRITQTGQNAGKIDANGAFSANLSLFPINERSSTIKGRFVGNQFVPYHTRHEINGGALNGRAPILGYANDPVELFFMHVQGSGRLRTPQGEFIRLGFADKNEYPYVSIGKYMANRGYLPLAQTSMQGIKSWISQNPQYLAEVLGQNPSYVFFRQLDGSSTDGPIGALGVPLSGEYSGAVDRQYITLGAPIFVATTHPDTRQPLQRLIMAQDTGSAIKGAVRVDYFWGYGDAAGATAGKMKNAGQVWQLLPHGVMPNQP